MSMIYLLYGNENTMINNRVKKIKREIFSESDEYIVNFDLKNDSLGSIIDEINQFFLIGDAKLIVVDNAEIFEKETKDKQKNNLLKELFNSIENIGENINLIFIVHNSSINVKSDLYKLILKNGKILEFKDIQKSDWPVYANQFFKKRNITISNEALNELIKRSNGDLNTFNNEANKLIIYKINNITLEDVEALVPQSLDDDVFKIMNSLNAGDKQSALKVYYDLRVKNIEPVTLINLFASSLLFTLNVKNLLNQNIKVDEIAKITGSSTGRVYVTIKNAKNFSFEFISSKLEKLEELDRKIKHSETDRFLAFETFLIEY